MLATSSVIRVALEWLLATPKYIVGIVNVFIAKIALPMTSCQDTELTHEFLRVFIFKSENITRIQYAKSRKFL